MYIKKLKSIKYYCKKVNNIEILGVTPKELQETIKAYKSLYNIK